MKTLHTSITINAPRADVWKALLYHEAYPTWNPFITRIEGTPTPGHTLNIQLQLQGQSPMTIAPKVVVNESEREFKWRGSLGIKGVFDGEHFFQLEAINERQTRLVHGENFSGILSGLMLMLIGKKTESGFKAMNEALKAHVEAKAQ